ncbi:hypothetical protein ElyMa_002602300 [Elysia marginata]|uniref:Uncharacterized protein n=1 Tax=Elysia marginata TaxID=1093978 RepID=A0AAV4H0Z0_9GAST|nr:hypothetical protein ElyMa_002602300 [Elysia marginata]
MAEAFDEPGYSADENKEGFVRLRVKLDGLKVHSAGILDRIRGRHPLPKGKNAEIENRTLTEREFQLIVRGTKAGEMKGALYKLHIRQLPYAIDPAETYFVGLEGFIEVFFKKFDETQSWEKAIRSGSLETFEG